MKKNKTDKKTSKTPKSAQIVSALPTNTTVGSELVQDYDEVVVQMPCTPTLETDTTGIISRTISWHEMETDLGDMTRMLELDERPGGGGGGGDGEERENITLMDDIIMVGEEDELLDGGELVMSFGSCWDKEVDYRHDVPPATRPINAESEVCESGAKTTQLTATATTSGGGGGGGDKCSTSSNNDHQYLFSSEDVSCSYINDEEDAIWDWESLLQGCGDDWWVEQQQQHEGNNLLPTDHDSDDQRGGGGGGGELLFSSNGDSNFTGQEDIVEWLFS